MDENHGTCEGIGKQHGGSPRYRRSGVHEKCGSELERLYLSPNRKERRYKLGEGEFLMGESRRGNIVSIMIMQENAVQERPSTSFMFVERIRVREYHED